MRPFGACWFVVIALILLLGVSGCTCGDDDDDNDDGGGDDDSDDDDDADDDDDDDTAQVDSAEDVVEYIITELGTDGENGAWMAYVLAEPLPGDVEVKPSEGETSFSPDGPYWFAYLDEDPFAQYEHAGRFLFIDEDTGQVTVEDQAWYPEIDGEALWSTDLTTLNVFKSHAAPTPPPAKKSAKDNGPDGDYGDAPDDEDAYKDAVGTAVSGHFPTLNETVNSLDDRPGGHTLTLGEETLGPTVSQEDDADDPDDSDGVVNLVDNDADDNQFYWVFYANPVDQSVGVRFVVDVAVATGAPDVTRYINVLVDHNRDGEWKKNGDGAEWMVENFEVEVAPGTSEWIWTDASPMPTDADDEFGFEMWIRVALTRDAIDGSPFGEDGWDGSGEFDFGEIEDYYFNLTPWSGDDDDDDDDDDDLDDDDDDDSDPPGRKPRPRHPDPPDPGDGITEKECETICEDDMIVVPYDCKVLIINMGDKPGHYWMHRNAQNAKKLFEARNGADNVTVMNRPTAEEALAAIEAFLAESRCLDERFIYITGHGSKDGWIRAQNGHGRLEVQDILDAVDALTHCPQPMNYYLGECRAGGYCNLNFLIQSCHSGTFTEGDGGLDRDGINVLTSASKEKSSYSKPDGSGSELSGAFWDAFKNDQADDPPNGDGDGEVSIDEAMKWAKDHMGGPDSDPQSHYGADCECVCNTPPPPWDDPGDDLEFWYQSGTPVYIPFLDIVTYNLIPQGPNLIAEIQMFGEFPESPQLGFFEFYMVMDTDPSKPNDENPGPANGGDQTIVVNYVDGVYNVFRFVYNASLGQWQPATTGAEFIVNNNMLTMIFPAAELGLVPGDRPPFRAATWTKDNDNHDLGDSTNPIAKNFKSACEP